MAFHGQRLVNWRKVEHPAQSAFRHNELVRFLVWSNLVLRFHVDFKPAEVSLIPIIISIFPVEHLLPVCEGFFNNVLHLDVLLVGWLVERDQGKVASLCSSLNIVAVG